MDGRDGSCVGSVDGIFAALNHPLRREVVALLSENPNRTFRVDDVVERLRQQASAPDLDRPELRIQLRHVHLPKLAEYDVVEFDPQGDLLRYLPATDVEEWAALIRDWEQE